MSILSNDPDQGTVSVSLSGIGKAPPAPDIALTSTSLSFGDVEAGQSATQTLTVSNTGSLALEVTSMSSSSPNFSLSSNSFTISSGSSRDVIVTFSPDSDLAYSETLTIQSNDTDEASVTVSLSGQGIQPNRNPVAASDNISVDVDGRINIPVLLNDTDPDGDVLTIQAVSAGANAQLVVANSDGTVHYRPNPGFVGSDTFTYIVVDGNGGSATGNVTVTVAGPVTLPQIQLSKTELLFGDVVVGSRDSMSLDISNPGNGDLVISNIVIGDQMFSVSNQSVTVAANASHTLQIRSST